MIKFFRRIRRKLLQENQMRKYLMYALGEILLVIIGILIALLINDWRLERQKSATEIEVLSALELEFEETKNRIEIFINGNEEIIRTAKLFIAFCNDSDHNIDTGTFDSLLYNTAWHYPLKLNQGVLNELLNTGKLSMLSNTKTRVLLSSWTALVDDAQEKERTGANYLNTMVIEYLDKNVAWIEMAKYDKGDPTALHNNKRNIDRYQLAKDLRMENFAFNQVWFCDLQLQGAKFLLKLNNEILNQIRNSSQ